MDTENVEQISLESSDKKFVNCDFNVAQCSNLISKICEEKKYSAQSNNMTISLPNASGRALTNFVKWANDQRNDVVSILGQVETLETNDIPLEDIIFLKNLDQSSLFEIILAANYLQVRRLLESSSKYIASLIKGKDPQGIRDTFKIPNDFTVKEEEQIRKENEWCEEK